MQRALVGQTQHLATLSQRELTAILTKATQKNVLDRYPSVAALSADLRAWLVGAPVSVIPQTYFYKGRKFIQRHWPVLFAAFFVLLLSYLC